MSERKPFFVGGLPRSMTGWASVFLSDGGVTCAHDLAAEASSFEQYLDAVRRLGGDCSSAVPILFPKLRQEVPDAIFAYIHRDPCKCLDSYKKMQMGQWNWILADEAFDRLEMVCTRMAASDGVFRVDTENLIWEPMAKGLWEWCRPGDPWNAERWKNLCLMNIQRNRSTLENMEHNAHWVAELCRLELS